MTLEQLRIFIKAANYQNFTMAATELGLSQAAVSLSIKKLEDEHDITLFDRTSRHFDLTPAGQVLLGEAERILRDVELTGLRLESYRRSSRRRLLVGCTPNVYNHWMPGVLSRIRGRNGTNHIEMVKGSAEEISAWVMRGTVDAGISESDPGHSAFRHFGAFRGHFVVCCADNSAFADKTKLQWNDIPNVAPLIGEVDTDSATAVQKQLERAKVDTQELFHKDVRFHSSEAVLAATLEGHYPGMVSERIAEPYFASGQLVRLGDLRVEIDYWCFGLQQNNIEPIAALISRNIQEIG